MRERERKRARERERGKGRRWEECGWGLYSKNGIPSQTTEFYHKLFSCFYMYLA